MAWRVGTLNAVVDSELGSLPLDMQARFHWIAELIESKGLARVGMPHVEHLDGKIWEIRMSGRDGIARALYQTASGQRIVVLRVVIKKTNKTPRREIELAKARARQIS